MPPPKPRFLPIPKISLVAACPRQGPRDVPDPLPSAAALTPEPTPGTDPVQTWNVMRSYFKAMDKNGDGYLTKQELAAVLQKCGEPLSDAEMVQFWADASSSMAKGDKASLDELRKTILQ